MPLFSRRLVEKIVAAAAGLGSIGAFGIVWLPHTRYLNEYCDVVRFYESGYPKPLAPDLEQRARKVLSDMTLSKAVPDVGQERVQFFFTSGIRLWNAGMLTSSYGARIGLPVTFTYRSTDDVHTMALALLGGRKNIKWETPAGRLLKESLVLSDDAMRFAIAQQIFLSNTSHVKAKSVAACASVWHVYILGKIMDSRLQAVPVGFRSVVYLLTFVFGVIGYLAISDLVTYGNDRDSITAACNLGADYRTGGVEFYEKCIVRNKALRVLMEGKGDSKYTVKGNDKTWIRTPRMPLSSCLKQVKKIKQEIEERCDVCEQISGSIKNAESLSASAA